MADSGPQPDADVVYTFTWFQSGRVTYADIDGITHIVPAVADGKPDSRPDLPDSDSAGAATDLHATSADDSPPDADPAHS